MLTKHNETDGVKYIWTSGIKKTKHVSIFFYKGKHAIS